MIRGHAMLRDDSAMNLSPEMFAEFIFPYDQRVLREFGGGGIHFCGKGDHYIERMSDMDGLHTVNFSQPHLNDMEVLLANTVDKGIRLVNIVPEGIDQARAINHDLKGLVQMVG